MTCIFRKAFRLALLMAFSSPCFAVQATDVYGGIISAQCGANPRVVSSGITSLSGSGPTATVVVSSAANFTVNDSVFFSGTGTGVDYVFPGGQGYAGLSNGNVFPTITSIASNTLTVAVPSGTYSSVTGTLTKAQVYMSKVNSQWRFCTPLGNQLFASGIYATDIFSTSTSPSSFDGIQGVSVIASKYAPGHMVPGGGGPFPDYHCNWAYALNKRLQSYGFNLLDETTNVYAQAYTSQTCYPGDQGMPSDARILTNAQLSTSLYTSVNRLLGNFNTQVAPGLTHNIDGLLKTSVISAAAFVKGFMDVSDWNFTQFVAGAMTSTGTSTYQAFHNPHHDFTAEIVVDESDEVPFGAAHASSEYAFWNNGSPVCGTTNYWCPVQASNTVGAGSVAYTSGTSTLGVPDYSYFVVVASPQRGGYKQGSNNVKGFAATSNDQMAVNNVTGLSGTLSGGVVTLTNVLGAKSFNGLKVWVTAGPGDWQGGPYMATGTQTGFSAGTVTFACGGCVTSSGSGITLFAPNTQYYLKKDMANWLQGVADQQTGVSAVRTGGTTVTLTFSSQQPFTSHDVLTVSSCSDSTFNTAAGTPVTVTSFTSTDQALHAPVVTNTVTYTQSGGGSSASGCVVGAGPGYGLSGLNTAWSSHYDSFGSDATTFTNEALTNSTGNTWIGSTAGALAHTPVTPMSISINSGTIGQMTAADDGCGPRAATVTQIGQLYSGINATAGLIQSSTGSNEHAACTGTASNVNYSTGALTVIYLAPTTSVTATYQTGGWGVGFGFLDEDGNCPAKINGGSFTCWLPLVNGCQGSAPPSCYMLQPGFGAGLPTAAFIGDLNNYKFRMAKLYLRAMASPFRTYAPGAPLEVQGTAGIWLAQNYWATGQYMDVTNVSEPETDPTGAITDQQARIDYRAANLGDIPGKNQFEYTSWNDDYYANQSTQPTSTNKTLDFPTQAAKGAYYLTETKAYLNAQVSSGCTTFNSACTLAGTFLNAGRSWYGGYDGAQGPTSATVNLNWGIFTVRDDAKDGSQNTPVLTFLTVGATSYWFGCIDGDALPGPGAPSCEPRSSGDFIDSVRTANQLWLGTNDVVFSNILVRGGVVVH